VPPIGGELVSRPRLAIGTFGDITVRVVPSGLFMARAMYRDWDGQRGQVQATGNTAKAAERALKGNSLSGTKCSPRTAISRQIAYSSVWSDTG
jgi:hypothetical protein